MMVYDRHAPMCEALVSAGATFTEPKKMAQEADYIFMMLGYPKDVRKVVLDSEIGILQHMKPGSTIIDCTTSSPELAQEIASEASKRGITSLDAPVSGGDMGAKAGRLASMVGGPDEEMAPETRNLIEAYSSQV